MSSNESKPSTKQSAKEEEEGLHDEKSLNSMVGVKKGRPSANANDNPSKPLPKVKDEEGKGDLGKNPVAKLAPSKAKKEETEEVDDDDDDKPIARRAAVIKAEKEMSVKKEVKEEDTKKVVKVEVKKRKTNVVAAVTEAAEQNGKKRVYGLPGQKRDPPEERDPLRIFYETLFKQIPHSEMVQFWMMEFGLLPREEAKKVFEKKQKSKLVSPAKSTPC